MSELDALALLPAAATPSPAPPPAPPSTSSPTGLATAPAGHATTFHEFLSELNPIQYVPVVGTIYRAVTGDTIPETARIVGSLVVSGLIGGPIGLATNLGLLAIEKATGIDPEKIATEFLASIGIGAGDAAPAAAASAPPAPVPPDPDPAAVAWSPSQLRAYGVTMGTHGMLIA